MSETRSLLADKKAITPLWIVALFVSLTETVLGVAVTQTSGGIQIALTIFVISFPLLIAACFFGLLWYKPYVFYPPTEFGPQVNVWDYVQAMQQRPALLKQYAEGQVAKPPTETQARAADGIVETFLSRLTPNGLLYLYAFSLAHLNRKVIVLYDLNMAMGFPADDDYAMGILSATAAIGLVSYKRTFRPLDLAAEEGRFTHVIDPIDMNEKLKSKLRKGMDDRLEGFEQSGLDATGTTREAFENWQRQQISVIENYFSASQ